MKINLICDDDLLLNIVLETPSLINWKSYDLGDILKCKTTDNDDELPALTTMMMNYRP